MTTLRTRHIVSTFMIAAFSLVGSMQIALGAEFNVADSDEAGLIAALNDANTNDQADVINLAANGIYTLTTADNTADGANGLPSITSKIVVNGNGAIIRRSSGAVPLFRILHVAASGNLILNRVILRNGHSPEGGSGSAPPGGGIWNAGMLNLSQCAVLENHTGSGGFSGGFIGNSGGNGGGIFNQGTMRIDSSTIQDNETGNGEGGTDIGGSGGDGGGISNRGILLLDNSTITANQTGLGGSGTMGSGGDGGGGGLYNDSGGDTIITASTISQNVSQSSGGGIQNFAQLFITSSTITENSATTGAGVRNFADLDMTHTIIASQNAGGDCAGNVPFSLGYNLDSDGSCSLTETGDQSTANPMLGPLQDNGGPTHTHAPLTGSPVIDAGAAAASQTDQRGFLRPFDGDGVGTVASDIGAVEFYDCNGDSTEDAPQDGDADSIPNGCDQCPGNNDLLDTDSDTVPDCLDVCSERDDTIDANTDGIPDCAQPLVTLGSSCCAAPALLALPLLLLGLTAMRPARRPRSYYHS